MTTTTDHDAEPTAEAAALAAKLKEMSPTSEDSVRYLLDLLPEKVQYSHRPPNPAVDGVLDKAFIRDGILGRMVLVQKGSAEVAYDVREIEAHGNETHLVWYWKGKLKDGRDFDYGQYFGVVLEGSEVVEVVSFSATDDEQFQKIMEVFTAAGGFEAIGTDDDATS